MAPKKLQLIMQKNKISCSHVNVSHNSHNIFVCFLVELGGKLIDAIFTKNTHTKNASKTVTKASLVPLFVYTLRHCSIRRAILLLTGPCKMGAGPVPDHQLYYMAALLTCVLYLFHDFSTKQWVALKCDLALASPTAILWSSGRMVGYPSCLPFLACAYMNFTLRKFPLFHLFTKPGPLTYILDNNCFPATVCLG